MNLEIIRKANKLVNEEAVGEDKGYCVLRFSTRRYNLLVDWKEAKGNL
jgi:hypothetical protein